MKPLAELWSERDLAEGPPPPFVTFDGERVWAVYEMELRDGDRLELCFEQVDESQAAQGVALAIENGAVFVDGQVHDELLKRLRLWSDTMPTLVGALTVVAHRPGDPVFMKVWHVWRRHDARRTDAWVGAYGFRVDGGARELSLRCNAGYAPPDFDDLVVRLAVNRDGAEAPGRLAELRGEQALLLARSGKRPRGSAKRNWKTMGDRKLAAAIEEPRRGRGAAYETCVMAGGDPRGELTRAPAAAEQRRRPARSRLDIFNHSVYKPYG